MTFTPTKYKLMNCGTGRVFEDEGWTLADPQGDGPALVRAVYEKKEFELRKDLDGFYRFADWLPIKRTLLHSHVPVTYKSRGLAGHLGLENLYITFSGYFPKIGARMETCSFKETEAYSVCARLPENHDKILVVASAGNTARAFAKVCSDNNIPLLLSVPLDNIGALWFHKPLNDCVKIIAAPAGGDYFDAIVLSDKVCEAKDRFMAEGGAKNIARRDGMGTVMLAGAVAMGRIPDHYFQAVGSGTGGISAWEASMRLIGDGRFGDRLPILDLAQNSPFTPMAKAWNAGRREITEEDLGRQRDEVFASIQSPNVVRIAGLINRFVYLRTCTAETSDRFFFWKSLLVSWIKAVEEGEIGRTEKVFLNMTGGGLDRAREELGMETVKPEGSLRLDMGDDEIRGVVDA